MPKITDREMKQLEKLKKRQKDQNEYLKGKYDRVNITVNKGYKSEIEAAAALLNVSVNQFCRNAIINAVNDSVTQSAQKAQTAMENQTAKESITPTGKTKRKPTKGDKTEAEEMAELQAMIDKKKADEADRKRKTEERKVQAEKERKEEFQNMVNGVVEGLKARKEKEREEDREKYKQLSDDDIAELLKGAPFSEWLEKIGFCDALDPLTKEIGVSNAEKVIMAAKERKRRESAEKAKMSSE